jgi:sigma-B regulation protein RsbU (phosphoserine phosphatase)
MMAAKTQLRDYLEASLPVEQAVDAANHQLCNGNDTGMFVTCWVGVLNYLTGELSYVNAGHNPPLLHCACNSDPTRDWQWMRKVSGMPLGLFDGLPYTAYEIDCSPGDQFLLYSDGVTEAMDGSEELYGEERLQKLLSFGGDYPAPDGDCGVVKPACEAVMADIRAFVGGAEQSDDITMLCIRYIGSE